MGWSFAHDSGALWCVVPVPFDFGPLGTWNLVKQPHLKAVSYELVTRIMRFVDYKLEKVSANNMDTSLISPTLQLELYVNQRADYLIQMPIFALAQECYPDTCLHKVARFLLENIRFHCIYSNDLNDQSGSTD